MSKKQLRCWSEDGEVLAAMREKPINRQCRIQYLDIQDIKKGDGYKFKILQLLQDNGIECNTMRTSHGNKFIGDWNIDLFGNFQTMNYIMQLKFKDPKYNAQPKDIHEFAVTLYKKLEGTIGIFITNVSYTDNA
ncbi:hypothetical protein Glove_114g201 [Diversispora epigaea]|uniref:Restriction endonuclease type IV Mrr domain-containing protein n=1 Tax=Diversispora epigaea TaxID=1348612 RepID=A0A397JAD2_9GLOM|nr:hypothetical protein Glove_114g201 [Diversispora epigaea]